MAHELRLAMEGRPEEMMPRCVVQTMPPQGMPTGRPMPPQRPAKKRNAGSFVWWLVTAIVTAFVIGGLYLGGREIVDRVVNTTYVPDMVTESLPIAQRSAERAGLKLEIIEVPNINVPAGYVISQSHAPNTALYKNDTVAITVSKGAPSLLVPSLVGYTKAEAIALLQEGNLGLATTEVVVSTEYQYGQIVSQIPEAGIPCQPGDMVQVILSGGSVFVPNLAGKTVEEARELVTDSGLTLNTEIQYQETMDASLHNTVAQQSHAADSQVIEGTTVTMTLFRVPSLTHATTVELTLQASESPMMVRVNLLVNGVEDTVWLKEVAPSDTRTPLVELSVREPGKYLYKVYINEEIAYQKEVYIE